MTVAEYHARQLEIITRASERLAAELRELDVQFFGPLDMPPDLRLVCPEHGLRLHDHSPAGAALRYFYCPAPQCKHAAVKRGVGPHLPMETGE